MSLNVGIVQFLNTILVHAFRLSMTSIQKGVPQAFCFFLCIPSFGPSVLKFYACNNFVIRWEVSIKWFFFSQMMSNKSIYFSHYLYSWSTSSLSLLTKPYWCMSNSFMLVCSCEFMDRSTHVCCSPTTQYFETNFRCFLLTWSFFSWYFRL